MSGGVIGLVAFAVVVAAVLVAWSRVGIVGPTALRAPEPSVERRASAPRSSDGSHGSDRSVGSAGPDLVSIWRVFGPVAVVGAAGCAVVTGTTFLPDPLVAPDGVVVALVLTTFALGVLTIATVGQMTSGRRNPLRAIASVSPGAWPLAAVLWAAFWLVSFSGGRGPAGDAVARDGGHFLVNHGELTEISREDYERYETLERRGTVAGVGGMLAPGIALWLYSRERHRRAT